MRKKIITVAATLLLLGLLSMVEQLSVERLTSEAMEKTQEILFLLAQNEPEQGLERARAMDAQAFVVGCDTAFTADVKLSFGVGHSLVAGPLGEVMGDVAGADPEVVLRTIDLAVAEKARAAVPILGADR